VWEPAKRREPTVSMRLQCQKCEGYGKEQPGLVDLCQACNGEGLQGGDDVPLSELKRLLA